MNKIPQQERELISIMLTTSQQFGSNEDNSRRVNEVSISTLESQISELTNLVKNMTMENSQRT